MSAEVVIRPVRREDAEAVYALRLQPSVIDGTLALPSLRSAEVAARLDSLGPDDHTLVAVVVGQVVGMAGLHIGRGKLRHGASLGMMVHDRFQGQGIGRMLLTGLLDLADNFLGLERIELEVFADNAHAIRLYERLGFEHEGRKRKAVWRHGEHQDVLIMGRIRDSARLA
ncbi:MAG: GNAT family N-acetyltransferase [Chloroflexi bacterium]|nr:GNAT family N-acetyltransferase [Chloroflexota bacterium]